MGQGAQAQFLSLTGVILRLDYHEQTLRPAIASFKAKYFPTTFPAPILHRSEILHRQNAFSILKDETIRSEFDNSLRLLLMQTEMTLCSVMLDKTAFQARYKDRVFETYAWCLEILVERFVYWLRDREDGTGDVMVEARGKREDMALRRAFRQMREGGTALHPADRLDQHLTSMELKVSHKQAAIPGLEIADLLASVGRRLVKTHCSGGEDPASRPTFDHVLGAHLLPKWYGYPNRLVGRGLKQFP